MRWDGSTACMAVDGATDTEVFRAYVQEVLCPTLRTGDVVIMDNLSPHKSTQAIELIQRVGAQVLFLPPYSPDLNPVEKKWSKLKEFLRSKEDSSIPAHTHRGHSPGSGAHHTTRRHQLVCLIRLQFYLNCSSVMHRSGVQPQGCRCKSDYT